MVQRLEVQYHHHVAGNVDHGVDVNGVQVAALCAVVAVGVSGREETEEIMVRTRYSHRRRSTWR